MQLRAFDWLARRVLQHLASDLPMSAMFISERILEVEARVIERVRVNVENVGDSDVSPVVRLWVLHNRIKRMLNDAISGLLAGGLVSTTLEFIVCEQTGSRSLIV